MPGSILVFVEHFRGEVTEATYEALALGREVAGKLGVPLEAALLGSGQKDLASRLGAASRVLSADHPALAEVIPETHAEALAQIARAVEPAAILTPLSNLTMGVGTLLAAQLQAPAVNFCVDLDVADGGLVAKAVLYGGKMEATVTPEGRPLVAGLWPGIRPPDAGRVAEPPAAVEDFAVSLPQPRIKLTRYIEPQAGDIDIRQQPVLVAVGRGIQSPDNIELAEELASALGGAVCGSRPVIDQGWLDLSRQVGKSGATVKPKLYLAVGISGAPEHVEGMRSSALIVAVNTDPQAPIFRVAHYGIVGDAMDILPALTEAVRRRSSAAHA